MYMNNTKTSKDTRIRTEAYTRLFSSSLKTSLLHPMEAPYEIKVHRPNSLLFYLSFEVCSALVPDVTIIIIIIIKLLPANMNNYM